MAYTPDETAAVVSTARISPFTLKEPPTLIDQPLLSVTGLARFFPKPPIQGLLYPFLFCMDSRLTTSFFAFPASASLIVRWFPATVFVLTIEEDTDCRSVMSSFA